MSIPGQITALQAARSAIAAAIEAKGVSIPPGTTFAGLAPLILLIEGGTGPAVDSVTHGGEAVTFGGEPVVVFIA